MVVTVYLLLSSSTFVVSSPNWLTTRTATFWPGLKWNGRLVWGRRRWRRLRRRPGGARVCDIGGILGFSSREDRFCVVVARRFPYYGCSWFDRARRARMASKSLSLGMMKRQRPALFMAHSSPRRRFSLESSLLQSLAFL